MKTIFLILIAFCLLMGCANTRFMICGVDVQEVKKSKGKNFLTTSLGIVTTVGTHILGHHLAAKLCDVDIKQRGLDEDISYPENTDLSDIRWVYRGGFVLQLAVNTALVELAKDSYFTKGFTGATCMQLLTYDFLHKDEGDFYEIDEVGGDGDLEHDLFIVWSAYNFYRISVKEKP